MMIVSPSQFTYQLLYKDLKQEKISYNMETFYKYLFSMLGLAPFDPVQLIK